MIDLIEFSLKTSIPLTLGLAAVILLSLLVNPEIWAGDYPPDIKAKFQPARGGTQKHKAVIAVLFFGWMIGWIVAALRGAAVLLGRTPTGLETGLVVFVLLETFNLFDLLVLDWLFFVRIQPQRIVLPGTEGMAGYRDDRFHFIGFLTGTAGILILSVVIGAGSWLAGLFL